MFFTRNTKKTKYDEGNVAQGCEKGTAGGWAGRKDKNRTRGHNLEESDISEIICHSTLATRRCK